MTSEYKYDCVKPFVSLKYRNLFRILYPLWCYDVSYKNNLNFEIYEIPVQATYFSRRKKFFLTATHTSNSWVGQYKIIQNITVTVGVLIYENSSKMQIFKRCCSNAKDKNYYL